MKVVVLTHSPSPYQVELFDALTRTGRIELQVLYLFTRDPSRQWKAREFQHQAIPLDQESCDQQKVLEQVQQADLLVANYYNDPRAARLISARVATGRPWCFWGERPGFKQRGLLGKLYRRWKLKALHQSHAPIWGIGRLAVSQYQSEFGQGRHYENIPYFSELRRFQKSAVQKNDQVTFLFSGSLSLRKGVDVLVKAFVRLLAENRRVKLNLLGDGDLRSSLEAMAVGRKDQIQFLGFCDWDRLPEYYAQADFLCVPSRYDGWGLVVPEGLAASLPVIGTHQTGAAVELIRSRENGWLVEGGDEKTLLAALREAASLTAEQREAMAAAARASVAGSELEDGVRRFLAAVEASQWHWNKKTDLKCAA